MLRENLNARYKLTFAVCCSILNVKLILAALYKLNSSNDAAISHVYFYSGQREIIWNQG